MGLIATAMTSFVLRERELLGLARRDMRRCRGHERVAVLNKLLLDYSNHSPVSSEQLVGIESIALSWYVEAVVLCRARAAR